MAKNLPSGDDPGPTAQHNIATINQAVIDGNMARLNLEKEIAALKEKHIRPLMDDLKAVIRKQKKDSNISSEDLKIFYALFKRQESLKDFIDDDEADQVRDHMRIVFGAMAKGGQLDFVDILQTEKAA